MKRILFLMALAAILGTVVGCEEEEEHEHHHTGGAYYGPEYPGYGTYHGYPNYQHPYGY